jgi:hypothetical protein
VLAASSSLWPPSRLVSLVSDIAAVDVNKCDSLYHTSGMQRSHERGFAWSHRSTEAPGLCTASGTTWTSHENRLDPSSSVFHREFPPMHASRF